MIDILRRYTKSVLYHSETAQTIAEAAVEAIRIGSDLRGANLSNSDLRGANLSNSDLSGANLAGANLAGANLAGANLAGADLPSGYPIASLCFGGWPVTVTSTETSIGCEQHPNEAWLGWSADAPEIAAMNPYATAWWMQHREAVCAVIRDVMRVRNEPARERGKK